VAAGLLEGTGLLAVLLAWLPGLGSTGPVLPVTGLALVAVNAALWIAYRATAAAEGIVPLSRRVMAESSTALHLVGHALPALAFLLALVDPGSDLSRGRRSRRDRRRRFLEIHDHRARRLSARLRAALGAAARLGRAGGAAAPLRHAVARRADEPASGRGGIGYSRD
jgi:hypothetical protein